jgi:predicted DNA-binding transcriptional regulator YafY
MSYKFDSLIAVLNKIDSEEKVIVQSIKGALEISERTAYRYIQTLQVAGFPIHFDRKKNSYVFTEGYSLRKPVLSVEETLAFALAKKMLKGFGEGIEKSFHKIEEKLSKKKADPAKHIVLKGEVPSPEVGNYLQAIHSAIVNFKKIELQYKTLYSDRESIRLVDPYYLFYQDGFWHLRGYCHLREDFRTFALDRIISLRLLDQHYLPKRVTPEEDLSGAFGSVVDGKPVEVILRFDKEIKQYVLRKHWHESQKTSELKDGKLEVTFNVKGIEGIKEWIYRWLPHVEVVAPKKLKEAIKQDLKQAIKRYG